MIYSVTNRQGFTRTGWRPQHTNPFQAAHRALMSGLGANPFGPEPGEPLPVPSMLHGLGSIVPDQSIVTWRGQVSGTPSQTVQDVISRATAALAADGLEVIGTSGLPFAIFDINIQLSSAASVTLTIQVNNGMGYGNPADIAAIVNHEIYAASGVMPAGAIASVQTPGTPFVPTAAGANMPNPQQPTDWSAWIQQNALWLGLGIVGLVILPDLVDGFR